VSRLWGYSYDATVYDATVLGSGLLSIGARRTEVKADRAFGNEDVSVAERRMDAIPVQALMGNRPHTL